MILVAVASAFPAVTQAMDRSQPPVNQAGLPLRDSAGKAINYPRERLLQIDRSTDRHATNSAAPSPVLDGFVPPTDGGPRPFWQYGIFGGGIGLSNIVIDPTPRPDGGAPEIVIGSALNRWQSIRHNPATGGYDQTFISSVFSSTINQIAVGDVMGDAANEIVVMLEDGRIYLYDFATKTELGRIETGVIGLKALRLIDLSGDTHAELVACTANGLFVFRGEGDLLWQLAGAGGVDLVVGQMDNDPALEIATTNGSVVDVGTHSIQWTYLDGFGYNLALAPLGGESYQQLISAEAWNYVYSYDVARQLPRWSIYTSHDIAAIAVADLERDGTPEILVGDGQWGDIHVYDLVTQAQKWSVPNPEHGVTNIAVGDVDGDGTLELLWGAGWTSSGPDYLYVSSTTGTHSIEWQSIDLDGPFLGPAIGDLDGDGQAELVFCSSSSRAGYSSGRILVFDLATLTLRGISEPVVEDRSWEGVNDLKLYDLDNDGRKEIVIAADYLYDGAIEIYSFDAGNTFRLAWTNTTRPFGSPFNKVAVADLDNDGTPEIIAGNRVAHTGSVGVYVYVFDYPAGDNPWRSVTLGVGFKLSLGWRCRT